MSSYTFTNNKFDKNKVFILQKSEIEKRFDPQFYKQEYKTLLSKIKSKSFKRLGDIVKFSSETWNQKDFFENTFPYIEISEINTLSGEIENISETEIGEAASRAKMIVRKNDIIISTTRPNRGAIALIKPSQDFSIASTGFSIIRNLKDTEINRDYLFTVLRQQLVLKQFEQRSSGGNYPAITQEELSNVLIPKLSSENQKKIISIFQKTLLEKQQNELEAEKLLASIDTYLLNQLGITLPTQEENTLKNRMFTSSLRELSSNRFDPHFNKVYFNEVFKSFADAKYPFKKIKEVLENIKTGTTPHQKLNPYSENHGIVFLRNTNLKKYQIDLTNTKYVLEQYENLLTFSEKDEVIMCIAGTVGLSAKNDVEIPISINQNVSSLKFFESIVNPDFATYWFNSGIFLELTKRACSVATIYYLNNDNLKLLPIPTPPIEKQLEIANYITAIRQDAQTLKDKTKLALQQANEEIEKLLLE